MMALFSAGKAFGARGDDSHQSDGAPADDQRRIDG